MVRPVYFDLLWVAIVWGACSTLTVQAQPADDADPFGDPAPAAGAADPAMPAAEAPMAGEVPQPADADPFGGPGPAAAAPRRPAANAAKEPEETDRFVLEIRASSPKSPVELTRAIQQMLDHGRPDEAKRYLEQLVAAKPDAATLATLHSRFGSALFLEILRTEELAPAGGEFAQAVLAAATAAARSPQRIQALIAQLNDSRPEVRRAAQVDLDDARDAALGPLLLILADDQRQAEHAGVRDALRYLAPNVVRPLIAALDAPQTQIRREAMDILGEVGATEATAWLIHPLTSTRNPPEIREAARESLKRLVGAVPSPAEARIYLFRQVQASLAGGPPAAADADDAIEIWRWDAEQKNSVSQRVPAKLASLIVARRLASDLFDLFPEDVAIRRAFLFALLESEKLAGGLDRPLPSGEGTAMAAAAAMGAGAIEDCLTYGMQQERYLAAAVAAEILGVIGNEELVQGGAGKPRPLVQALRAGDRRLRVAACEALARIDPQLPYGGSSLFTDTLAFLLNTGPDPRVLVGHPRLEISESLVGLASEIGYSADSATRGSELLLAAGARADYTCVLISDTIDHVPVRELIQYLRADSRTAHLPIGIMTRGENLTRMQEFAETQRFVLVFPQPRDGRELMWQLQRLNDTLGPGFVTHDVRLAQASRALATLLMLNRESARYPFYDLLRYEPDVARAQASTSLGPAASEILGYQGTPSAQRYLVSLASQNGLPLLTRQTAAKAFATAVQRRGLLLTRSEILLQYERYNQSAKLDRDTQRVLGSVLDAIEAPSGKSSRPSAAKPPSPVPPSDVPPAGPAPTAAGPAVRPDASSP